MSTQAPRPDRPASAQTHLRRRLRADRAATALIVAGGFSMVLTIVVIFVFLAREVWPLFAGADLSRSTRLAGPDSLWLLGTDPYQDVVWSLDGRGHIQVFTPDGRQVQQLEMPLDSLETLVAVAADGGGSTSHFAVGTATGRLLQCELTATREETEDGQMTSRLELSADAVWSAGDSLLSAGDSLFTHLVMARGEGRQLWAWLESGRVQMRLRDEDEGITAAPALAGELDGGVPERLAAAPGAERLALALPKGELAIVEVSGTATTLLHRWSGGLGTVSALTFLTGGSTLVAGDDNGALGVWLPLADEENTRRWVAGRPLPAHAAGIRHLVPSPRERSFLSLDENGMLKLLYSTSGNLLAETRLDTGYRDVLAFSPRADALLGGGPGGIEERTLHNPHGDVSLGALAARMQYEGYPEPAWIWQSTGGSDDFEPKYSFIPLIFGTLKGTFFALLISVPLALLAAIYVSHFAPPALARSIKPVIEIMAALPSVIIGFLAGLVFAPYLETHLTALLAFPPLLVLLLVAMIPVWQRLPGRLLEHAGAQLGFGGALLVLALLAGYTLAPALDAHLFGGSLIHWLNTHLGLVYDQRNSLVVGFALGFAVIPIIFTMSEDALGNVPDSQVGASLALGASRWHTVVHVVLPGAAAGVFAAVMIGLGRAIGETMIVLMATGNTPLLDWSPFNGFRTMSACIAVEIPEAPVGGSLYRLLFAVALLLFVFTFLVNTAASLIGERLRKRQGRI